MPNILLSAISRSATGRRASAVVRIAHPVAGWWLQSNGSFKAASGFEAAVEGALHYAAQASDTTLLNVAAGDHRRPPEDLALEPWWVAGSTRSNTVCFTWPAGHGARAYSLPMMRDKTGTRAWEAVRCRGETARTVTSSGNTGDCALVCTSAWWQAVGELEMGLDLAASATPAEWLERMEDRLLDPAPSGAVRATSPGRYAALALWVGSLPNEA